MAFGKFMDLSILLHKMTVSDPLSDEQPYSRGAQGCSGADPVSPPPFFGGPQNFKKEEKNVTCVCANAVRF